MTLLPLSYAKTLQLIRPISTRSTGKSPPLQYSDMGEMRKTFFLSLYLAEKGWKRPFYLHLERIKPMIYTANPGPRALYAVLPPHMIGARI